MLRWFEHSQVYRPDRVLDATGHELGRPFEDVLFKAKDGVQLHGWFFLANSDSHQSDLCVLVCHGNAGNISHRLDLCGTLLECGLSVFLFDYRGYGRSEGIPGEEGTYLDAQAAYEWLRKKGIPGRNIIAFGESLGGGIASELALRETLGGVILQSTFSCIADLGSELFPWLPVRWLGSIKYNTCSKLPRIGVPVMVMHSRADALIAYHHAEKNFALANEPKLFWEVRGDHNEPLLERDQFITGIRAFLKLLPPQRVGVSSHERA
ncbi:MAG TPA: alpha/beta hydrolase [Candidatus Dormibacteraeota bacterium]|nr:alpha/beta hydrolase [Candidatus Dormibacteraeota bacterium]